MPPREGSDVGCNKIPAERGKGMQRDYPQFLTHQNRLVIPSEARDLGSSLRYQRRRRSKPKVPRFAREDSWYWGKIAETRLDSRFGLRMRQRLHFFLINLDLAGLLHLIAHVVHKQPEELLLLVL